MAEELSRDDDVPLMPFSCHQCRNRKLKCDRLKPECTRCSTSSRECQYPSTRKRPTITATRPKVRQLEARLTDLEHRLKSSQSTETQTPKSSASSTLEEELIGTGRLEQLPPQEMVEELTNIYFTSLHSEAPMLHPERYIASLYSPPHMQPPMALQYAIMALGSVLSPAYSQLSQAFYKRARQYLENDEMRDEGQDIVTLAHCQASVLLGNFEVQNLWFSRATLSIARSIRLAQILGLDRLDGDVGLGPTIPPPRDWCEKEERRRTMWVVFCNDRGSSSTTGWTSLLNAHRIRSLLPVSEAAFRAGIEEPSITLCEALNHTTTKLSAFACRVLAAHLFHECLDHTYREDGDFDRSSPLSGVFWKTHEDLNNGLASAFVTLPEELRCPEDTQNHDAVFINLQLHTATICLHRIGAARAKKQNLPPEILGPTQVRLLPAAQEIFTVLACLRDLSAMFRNPMVAFAAYMAAFVFLEDFVSTQNRQSEDKMGSLLDLMVAIGHQNPVTASLAIQMAYEVKKTGIDSSAMLKVEGLMNSVDWKGPLLAKQNESSGGIVFCPFEPSSGSSFIPDGAPRFYPTAATGWS